MIYLIWVFYIIGVLFSIFAFCRKTRYSIHMLQQSSYRSGDFLKWCDENITRNLSFCELAAMAVTLVFFFVTTRYFDNTFYASINCGAVMIFTFFGVVPFKKHSGKNAKKPLNKPVSFVI